MNAKGERKHRSLGLLIIISSVIVSLIRGWRALVSRPTAAPPTIAADSGDGALLKRGYTAERFVIAILLFALLASLTVRVMTRRQSLLPAPVIGPVSATVSDPTLFLKGMAEPHASVTLSISDIPDVKTEANGDGIFQTVVTLPKGGDYVVTARAQAASSGALSPASQAVEFKFDPNWAPPTLIRKVTAFVSYRSVQIDIQATAPSEQDSGLRRLLTGQKLCDNGSSTLCSPTLFNFTFAEFPGFSFHGKPIYFWFQNVTPQYTLSNKTITLRASSRQQTDSAASIFNGILDEEIGINLPPRKSDELADMFVLIVRDYDVTSVNPLPTTPLNNSIRALSINATPTPTPEPSPTPALAPTPTSAASTTAVTSATATPTQSSFTLKLAFHPLSDPENLLKLFRLTPDDFTSAWSLGDLWRNSIRILRGLLLALPMLWLLRLLSKETAPGDSHFRQRLRRVAYALAAVCLVSSVISLLQTNFIVANYNLGLRLNHTLKPYFGTLPTENYNAIFDLLYGLLKIVILAVLPVMLLLASYFFDRLRLGRASGIVWIRTPSKSFIGALLISMFFVFASWLYRKILGDYSLELFAEIGAVLVLLCISVLLVRMWRAQKNAQTLSVGWLVALYLLFCLFAFPFDEDFLNHDIASLLWSVRLFFSTLQTLMPYALLPGLLALLRQADDSAYQRISIVSLGMLFFASFVVGVAAQWLFIPLPFLLAIWVYPHMVVKPRALRESIDEDDVKSIVFSGRREGLLRLLSGQSSKLLDAWLELEEKLIAGEMTHEAYDKKRVELESRITQAGQNNLLPHGLTWKELALNFGPYRTNFDNGLWSARHALILTFPFVVLYLWEALQREAGLGKPYLPFYLFSRTLIYFADWFAAGFFFGYFFPYLRGDSGLKKGLFVASAVVFCLLPTWLFSLTDTTALFLRAGQTFLFFSLLGLLAFDFYTLRDELKELFDWRKLVEIQDMPTLTAFASVALGSLGVTVTSVLTGQFESVFTQIVKLVFQQLPTLQTVSK
jgi:hypothetical protein